MADAPFLGSGPGGADPDAIWWAKAQDGVRLRCALWHAPAGQRHVVLLPGRTEFLEKVSIVAAGFVARGWSVLALDWRGQGLSDRLIPERPLMGHVGAFSDYGLDLDALLSSQPSQSLPGPAIWFGHSMGGAIAMAALDGGHAPPEALILSAPMIRVALPAIGRLLARATIRLASLTGRLDTWPPFGDVKTPYPLQTLRENVLTSDQEVWAWLGEVLRSHPELGLGLPSIRWFGEAEAISRNLPQMRPLCPVLMVTGAQDRVVDIAAAADLARQAGWAHAAIPGARHEPFVEAAPLRDQAWHPVDAFLQRLGTP